MFCVIKGEIRSSHFEKIKKATILAKKILNSAIEKNYDTDWLEKNVSETVKILDIDSLLTIPISLPFMKDGMVLSREELLKTLKIISKSKEVDFGSVDSASVVRGDNVYDEYKILLDENEETENNGSSPEAIGIQIPSTKNVNEATIYDMGLINSLKIKFKEWRCGWSEQHQRTGDEFDEESYIEGHEPFFTDIKKSYESGK